MDPNKIISMLSIDCTVADWLGDSTPHSPEKELCFKMILRAIYDISALSRIDYSSYSTNNSMFPKSECKRAKDWLDEAQEEPPVLSYHTCCEVLGIEKTALRRAIYKLLERTNGRLYEIDGTRIDKSRRS